MEKEVLDFMLDPKSYPEETKKVEHIQTHISHVFLIDGYVYKIKKPVDFGFLDFSTLEKRKHFCEEELKLNSRVSEDIYLNVVGIAKNNDGKLKIVDAKKDGIIEYALRMKRMPQDAIMKEVLDRGKVTRFHLRKIAEDLSNMYSKQTPSKKVKAYGKPGEIKKKTDQNFEQTEKYVKEGVFDKKEFEYIKKATNDFLEDKKGLFNQRINEGRIVEFHGDLHTGNIFVTKDDVKIFDCIEFNEPFRMGDVAEDIGFLAMDLDFQKRSYDAKYLITKFVELSKDYSFYTVLDFYKCYRAYVRAKVTAFLLDDPNIPKEKKEEIKKIAQKYFHFAYGYALIFADQKPALVISCGLSGTGKSRWGKVAADIMNASIIRTDAIRKEALGIPEDQDISDEYGKGYYSKENREKVYDYIFDKIKNILKNGGKIVFDAAFINKEMRTRAKKIAEKENALFSIVNTTASDQVIKNRIEARSKRSDNDSDTDFAIYLKQKENYDFPSDEEGELITIDTEKPEFHNLKYMKERLGKLFGEGFKVFAGED